MTKPNNESKVVIHGKTALIIVFIAMSGWKAPLVPGGQEVLALCPVAMEQR